MSCQGCQGEAVIRVSWLMSEGIQRGQFCRACARQLQHQYPNTTFTYGQVQEAA